jgi:NarL family two-component system response regulator LiaR
VYPLAPRCRSGPNRRLNGQYTLYHTGQIEKQQLAAPIPPPRYRDDNVFPAIQAGAQGYLLKDSSAQTLIQAIRDEHRGEPSMHPIIAHKLIRERQRSSDLPPTEQPLTEREVEVLKLVARGLSNQEIADDLVVSERTVRTHVSNILDKLHLANRTQAALYALREGLASLDET